MRRGEGSQAYTWLLWEKQTNFPQVGPRPSRLEARQHAMGSLRVASGEVVLVERPQEK